MLAPAVSAWVLFISHPVFKLTVASRNSKTIGKSYQWSTRHLEYHDLLWLSQIKPTLHFQTHSLHTARPLSSPFLPFWSRKEPFAVRLEPLPESLYLPLSMHHTHSHSLPSFPMHSDNSPEYSLYEKNAPVSELQIPRFFPLWQGEVARTATGIRRTQGVPTVNQDANRNCLFDHIVAGCRKHEIDSLVEPMQHSVLFQRLFLRENMHRLDHKSLLSPLPTVFAAVWHNSPAPHSHSLHLLFDGTAHTPLRNTLLLPQKSRFPQTNRWNSLLEDNGLLRSAH